MGFLGDAASALGSFIKEKPEQFAIGADMIGRNLAPNNAFAGVGTMFGQSSLANKAQQSQQGKFDQIIKLLSGLTEAGKPGGNNVTIKRGPNGLVVNTSSDVPDSALGGEQLSRETPPVSVDDRGVVSLQNESANAARSAVTNRNRTDELEDFLNSLSLSQ